MKINSKIVSDKFEDEVVVVSLESGAYYSLRNSSADVWSLLENNPSTEAITTSFDSLTPEQENEIKTFIDFLFSEKLIIDDDAEIKTNDGTRIKFSKIEYSKFDDMADLIMIDPIHEADPKKGWPNKMD